MKKCTDLAETVVLNSDDNLFFDVDETLIFWKIDEKTTDPVIQVQDPYVGNYITLVPHIRHIELLKRAKGQGRKIIVWSAGGYAWAESVIKTLGLEKYVDLIMAKPIAYVDDRTMNDWQCQRIYLTKDHPAHPISK